jgi:uncharacterized membrane protein
MVRKHSSRLYRYTRPIMAGLATLGAVITAYLTVAKLTDTPTVCPTSGCDIVMASPYASVFGIPLSLLGFFAYVAMIGLAIAPQLINRKHKTLRANLDQWTQLLLLVGATSMLVFSGYLMYLIFFEIQAVCIYCVSSAFIATMLFGFSLFGQTWRDRGQPLFIGITVAILVLVGALGVHANADVPQDKAGLETKADVPGEPGPPVTTQSGAAEIALADHLSQIGAKMYGAFWCPHCHDQKQLFGQEAFSRINYIECDPRGQNPQPQMCSDAGVPGYPAWEINGQLVAGTHSLEQLADLSGYEGSRNFSIRLNR